VCTATCFEEVVRAPANTVFRFMKKIFDLNPERLAYVRFLGGVLYFFP